MFGYIRPLECELRVRELTAYCGYYCGVCRAIGARYGLLARMMLRYDSAFLGALFSAAEGEAAFAPRFCALHPLRGKRPVALRSAAIDYAADVNVLLGYCALRDHWHDEKNVGALLMSLLLRRAYRRAAAAAPALSSEIGACLNDLAAIEKRGASCTDEPCDAFGRLMRAVAAHAPLTEGGERVAWQWTLYNLGRWVYLADAWDDRAKDVKHGAYNPFLAAGATREDAMFLLNVSLTEAEKGYDLLQFSGEHGLTDNIIRLGCRAITGKVLGEGTNDTPAEGENA